MTRHQTSRTRPRTIAVTIDALVLRGLASADGREAIAALRDELQRLLGDCAAASLRHSHSIDALPAARMTTPAGGAARSLGVRAAATVVQGARR